VLVGTATVAEEAFRAGPFVMALLGSMALQAGTNLVNDYYDHTQGIDTASSLGPSGVIQRGLLSPGAVLLGGLVCFAIGAALGITLAVIVGWQILPLGIASVIAGYAYTAPPLKLAYRGLGELTTFVFMGPVIVMGAAYVQIEAWSSHAFLASLPIGLLVASILHANNLRDIDDDRAHGKHTLATMLGRPLADYEQTALVVGAYAVAIALIAVDEAPVPALLVLASFPAAVSMLRTLARSRQPRELNRVLMASVGVHLLFGLLWALGYAIEAWR
jgi:1,4-dihydroxy-2-naphthoate octaprenyltransferase